MSDDVTVYLVGDVRVERDPEETFALCAERLHAADILFGNLETVISDAWDPEDVSDLRLVGTPESMLPGYIAAGFGVLNVANNPSMRFGWKALSRCMELLEGVGIAHVGGGRNLEEARRPAIIERNGTKVAFLGYSTVTDPAHGARKDRPGVNRFRVDTAYRPPNRFFEVPGAPPIIITTPDPHDLETLRTDIGKAKEQAEVVIVSWHWGISPASGGKGELVSYQTELGHACIDAGADLVVGHHPHLLQGVEVYRGKAIFYSLADFTPGGMTRSSGPKATLAVSLQVSDGAVRQISFIPGEINERDQPVFLNRPEAEALTLVKDASAPFDTPFRAEADGVVVETTAVAEAISAGR